MTQEADIFHQNEFITSKEAPVDNEDEEGKDIDDLLFINQDMDAKQFMYEPGMQMGDSDLKNFMTLERYQAEAQILLLQERVEGEKLQRIQDELRQKSGIRQIRDTGQQMTFQENQNGENLVRFYDPITQTYVLKQFIGDVEQMQMQIDKFGKSLEQITDPVERAKEIARFRAFQQKMGLQEDLQGQTLAKVWDPQTQTYVIKPFQGTADEMNLKADKYGNRLMQVHDPSQRDQNIGRYNGGYQQLQFKQDQDGQELIKIWDEKTQSYVLNPIKSDVNNIGMQRDQQGNPLNRIQDIAQQRQDLDRHVAESKRLEFEQYEGQKLTKYWDPLTQTYQLKPLEGGTSQMELQINHHGQKMNQVWDPQTQSNQLKPLEGGTNQMELQINHNGQKMNQVWDPLTQSYQLKPSEVGINQMELQIKHNGQKMNQVWDPQTQTYQLKPIQSDQNLMNYKNEDNYGDPLKQIHDPEKQNQLNQFKGDVQQDQYDNTIQGLKLVKVNDFNDKSDSQMLQYTDKANKTGFRESQGQNLHKVTDSIGNFKQNQHLHENQDNQMMTLTQRDQGLPLKRISQQYSNNAQGILIQEGSNQMEHKIQIGQTLNRLQEKDEQIKGGDGKAFFQNPQIQQFDDENGFYVKLHNVADQEQRNPNRYAGKVIKMDQDQDKSGQNLQRIDDSNDLQKPLPQTKIGLKKIQTSDSEGEQLMKYGDDEHQNDPVHSVIQFAKFESKILDNQGSNLQKLEDLSPDKDPKFNKNQIVVVVNDPSNSKIGNQLNPIKDINQLNRIKNDNPLSQTYVLNTPEGDQLIQINDDSDNKKNNIKQNQQKFLAPLKPPRGQKLNKISALDDRQNQDQRDNYPPSIQQFNSNENIDLEPYSDQFTKQNDKNPVQKKNLVNLFQNKRNSIEKVSQSVPQKQQNKEIDGLIINNNPVFEFEVWSTNKIINKYQHFLIDQQMQFPSIPVEYNDLVEYNRFKDFKDSSFEKIKFAGFTKNGLLQGRGVLMRYPTGAIYDGLWNEGLFVWGVVLELNPNNNLTRYIGPYNQEYKRKHGIGRLEWHEQSGSNFTLREHHEGQFVLGQIRELGIRTYENEDIYDGEWKNNVREGFGKLQYKLDEERYEGMFSKDKFSGPGSYFHKDGMKEVGEYKDGKSIGEHKIYDQQDQLIKQFIQFNHENCKLFEKGKMTKMRLLVQKNEQNNLFS